MIKIRKAKLVDVPKLADMGVELLKYPFHSAYLNPFYRLDADLKCLTKKRKVFLLHLYFQDQKILQHKAAAESEINNVETVTKYYF